MIAAFWRSGSLMFVATKTVQSKLPDDHRRWLGIHQKTGKCTYLCPLLLSHPVIITTINENRTHNDEDRTHIQSQTNRKKKRLTCFLVLHILTKEGRIKQTSFTITLRFIGSKSHDEGSQSQIIPCCLLYGRFDLHSISPCVLLGNKPKETICSTKRNTFNDETGNDIIAEP
jgi:hypothetical protein